MEKIEIVVSHTVGQKEVYATARVGDKVLQAVARCNDSVPIVTGKQIGRAHV